MTVVSSVKPRLSSQSDAWWNLSWPTARPVILSLRAGRNCSCMPGISCIQCRSQTWEVNDFHQPNSRCCADLLLAARACVRRDDCRHESASGAHCALLRGPLDRRTESAVMPASGMLPPECSSGTFAVYTEDRDADEVAVARCRWSAAPMPMATTVAEVSSPRRDVPRALATSSTADASTGGAQYSARRRTKMQQFRPTNRRCLHLEMRSCASVQQSPTAAGMSSSIYSTIAVSWPRG